MKALVCVLIIALVAIIPNANAEPFGRGIIDAVSGAKEEVIQTGAAFFDAKLEESEGWICGNASWNSIKRRYCRTAEMCEVYMKFCTTVNPDAASVVPVSE